MENGFNVLRDIQAGQRIQPTPELNFMQTVGASLAYKYDPLISRVNEQAKFPTVPQDGYRARDYIPQELEQYASTLLRATNQEHMDYLINQVRDGIKTREQLAASGVIAQFGAELFDPINYIGIPFARAATFGSNFLRGGAATAAVVAGQEAIRYPLDPVATEEEVALNIGTAFAMGGLLTGLVTIPTQRKLAAQRSAEEEIANLQRQIAPDGEEPVGEIAPSIFTDSWLYKGVTTPMKRVLTDKTIPNSVKLRTLKIANDSGILLAANKQGQKVGNSVFQNAKLLEGEWVRAYDKMLKVWGDSTGEGVINPLDYTYKRADFETWLEGVDSKAMRGIEAADDFEAQAMETLNKFYETWEQRLSEQGLIGTQPHYEKFIANREKRVADAQKRLETARNVDFRAKLEEQVRRYSAEADEARAILDDLKDAGPVMPANEMKFRPRYWDHDAIRANREELERILAEWYRENPSVIVKTKDQKFERVTLSTDPDALAKRSKDTVDEILGLSDLGDIDNGYFGAGKSKHFKHRLVDIPNARVLDFIETNPVRVMKAYVQRTGGLYEFARMFEGASIDDVLDDTFNEFMEAGATPEKAYAAMKDMRHLYKRVVGGVFRDPSSMDQQAARIMRDLAQLNYLGSAGISTITEPAKIMMEHGIGPTFRGLFNIMKSNQLRMGGKEGRIAGEALETLMGSAHLRLVDDVNNNPLRSDILDKAKDAFYLLNGLGPITRIFKDFDAMVRSHSLIDYSVRWTQGKATKQEQEYLLRYNIDFEDAKKIANAPWQKSESGMYMANTDAWTNTIEFPSTTAEIVSGPTNTYAFKKVKQKVKPPKGFSRDDILDGISKGDANTDLAFHVTVSPDGIIEDGFSSGGATVGVPHFDKGYGNYIAVFDIRDVKNKFNVGKDENLLTSYRGIAYEPVHKSKFAQDLYGEASFALSGEKPIAVVHVTEVPEFMASRTLGARAEELGLTGSEAAEDMFYNELERLALLGRDDEIAKLDGFYIFVGEEPTKEAVKEIADRTRARLKNVKTYTDYKPLENIYEDVTVNGRYKPAFYREKENKVYIDEEYIKDVMYAERGWENPRVEGVKPIEAGIINSPDDYVTFIKMHEIMHTKFSAKDLGITDKRTKEGKAAYENAINDLAVAEIKKQARVDPETVRTFRNALGSGIMNTILMGTPADKPIITDGIVYIPMRVARQFGMKEDAEFKGYARIENALLGLPFQFYSYSLAAVNKVTAAYAHGQLKNQYIGTAIAMGLGYMVLQYKTPDFVDLSFQDQLARSFDYSGVAALYSDMFYTGMSTSLALGGPNLTGGVLQPRFPQKPNQLDAATGLLGAGPSISVDIARGAADLVTGNVGEGTKEIIRNLPFARMWFWKGKMNEFTRMLEEEINEPSGFGRY